jgi:hypothetical protein
LILQERGGSVGACHSSACSKAWQQQSTTPEMLSVLPIFCRQTLNWSRNTDSQKKLKKEITENVLKCFFGNFCQFKKKNILKFFFN